MYIDATSAFAQQVVGVSVIIQTELFLSLSLSSREQQTAGK